VAFGDVDLDGDLDLACADKLRTDPGCLLFKNAGGRFGAGPDWAGINTNGIDVALGDIDGDGLLDLACANDGDLNAIYRNIGGTFEPAPSWVAEVARRTFAIALGDMDGDGDLDLVTGNVAAKDELHRNDGGSFRRVWQSGPVYDTADIALGDVNGDGRLDLVCASGNITNPCALYLNVGGDSVLAAAPSWTSDPSQTNGVALGDLDGDGDLDLVLGNNRGFRNIVFWNDGTSFAGHDSLPGIADERTESVALGDMDDDGDLDLLVGNLPAADRDKIYRNDGGVFAPAPIWCSDSTDVVVSKTVVADIDGDGDLDPIFAGNRVTVYRNTVAPYSPVAEAIPEIVDAALGLKLADVDADGDLDVVLGNAGPSSLYRNDRDLGLARIWESSAASPNPGVAVGDVDLDGGLDLAFGGPGPETLYLRRSDTGEVPVEPSWTSALSDSTSSIALGDVNRDGILDLVSGNLDLPNRLYLGNGESFEQTPSWQAQLPSRTRAVALGDLDSDGDLDLVCGNAGPNTFYLNHGGTLEGTPSWRASTSDNTQALALGDFNGDSRLDLACGNHEVINTIYLNRGGSTIFPVDFDLRTLFSARTVDVMLADADRDGDLDFFNANLGLSELNLNDLGLLELLPAWTAITTPTSMAIGDIDQDGDPDAIMVNTLGAQTELFRSRKSPPFKGSSKNVANQVPNNSAHLSGARFSKPAPNVVRVDFLARDVESDPTWVLLDYQYAGEPVWSGGLLDGPFATSPEGISGAVEWTITEIPFDARDAVLRLRAIEVPAHVSEVSHAAPYFLEVGPLTPERPVLVAPRDSFVFPVVTVGDTTAAAILLRNDGTADLVIQASDVSLPVDDVPPSSFFQIASAFPIVVPAGETDSLTILLGPREIFDIADSVQVTGNDPLLPGPLSFPVAVDIRELEVVTEALTQGEVPVGDAVTVLVTPKEGVNVERGTLFHRAVGENAFVEVPLAESGSGDVFSGVISGEFVTETGVEYYVEVENSGLVRTDPANAPGNVFTLEVGSPSFVRSDPVPNDRGRFTAGRAVAIRVILPDGAVFRGGTLFHRPGGASNYDAIAIAQTGLEPEAVIPDSAVGARGIEYWIRVRTATSDSLTDPPSDPAAVPRTIRTTVENLREGSPSPGGSYRMVSMPLDFEGELLEHESIANLLADEPGLGAYDPTRWRLFRYFPNLSQTLEFAPEQASAFQPMPGRAFWLISNDEHQVDTRPFAGTSPATDTAYELVLEPGWNQIANPFAFPVAWASVARSLNIGDPHEFGRVENGRSDYLPDPAEALKPFSGYFVKNFAALPETIRIAPDEAVSVAQIRPTSERRSDAEGRHGGATWAAALELDSAFGVQGRIVFGTKDGASFAWDSSDREAPPLPPDRFASIAIDHRDWELRPGFYRRDFRDPSALGQVFKIELRGTSPARRVTLSTEVEALPEGFELQLVDLDQQVSHNLLAEGDAPFLASTHPAQLEVVVGPRQFVEEEMSRRIPQPGALRLDASVPNPLRGATRIRFGLPEASTTSLSVHDLAGRLVATVVEARRLGPGFHTAVWDGRDDGGHAVASGIYFYRLVTEQGALSRKLLVLR
jgi:hypothetical protein